MSSVDVIIPCYKYAHYLRACVESVLSQVGVDIRVLIIDDSSPDNTPDVCAELASMDHRVEYLRHKQNQGHIATYNEGLLDWSSSDYSLLLSADDALAPGALSRATQLMERHRDVGMTCGIGRIIYDDESYSPTNETFSNKYRIVLGSDFLQRCFTKGNPVCTPTAVVRTELQQHLGGYRADFHIVVIWRCGCGSRYMHRSAFFALCRHITGSILVT